MADKFIDKKIVMNKFKMQTFCDTTHNSSSDNTKILKLQQNQKIKLGQHFFPFFFKIIIKHMTEIVTTLKTQLPK